jgi:hypothetical protein
VPKLPTIFLSWKLRKMPWVCIPLKINWELTRFLTP